MGLSMMMMINCFSPRYEDYRNPRTALYVTLLRTFLLNIVVIGTTATFWLKHSDEVLYFILKVWLTYTSTFYHKSCLFLVLGDCSGSGSVPPFYNRFYYFCPADGACWDCVVSNTKVWCFCSCWKLILMVSIMHKHLN